MRASCRVTCNACVVHRKTREPSAADKRVFFDVELGGVPVSRIVIHLFSATHPKTTENFRALCTGEKGWGYQGTNWHRVIPGFVIQAGAKGGSSIYGGSFEDENFTYNHDEPYLVSMANGGPNTNADQYVTFRDDFTSCMHACMHLCRMIVYFEILEFLYSFRQHRVPSICRFFITVAPAPHLDGKHVVFGTVVSGTEAVEEINAAGTAEGLMPIEAVIVKSGEL